MSDLMSDEEARLLSVFRAIKELEHEAVTTADTSAVVSALESTFDMAKKEAELSAKELKHFLLGFVGGVAVAQVPEEPPYLISPEAYEELDRPVAGGPSNQIPEGQEVGDPRYVHQSGPQPPEAE